MYFTSLLGLLHHLSLHSLSSFLKEGAIKLNPGKKIEKENK